jgi:hypothetical protein
MAKTKVWSRDCVSILASSFAAFLQEIGRESALRNAAERASNDGIVKSIRRVRSYFRLSPTGARNAAKKANCSAREHGGCLAISSGLWSASSAEHSELELYKFPAV